MYILLEYAVCVILVAVAVAAILTVGWACVALVQNLYRAALKIGRLLPRPSLAALKWDSMLFRNGDSLVAVKVSDREEQGRLTPLDRSGRGLPSDPW
jgi:hypothetical protein